MDEPLAKILIKLFFDAVLRHDMAEGNKNLFKSFLSTFMSEDVRISFTDGKLSPMIKPLSAN